MRRPFPSSWPDRHRGSWTSMTEHVHSSVFEHDRGAERAPHRHRGHLAGHRPTGPSASSRHLPPRSSPRGELGEGAAEVCRRPATRCWARRGRASPGMQVPWLRAVRHRTAQPRAPSPGFSTSGAPHPRRSRPFPPRAAHRCPRDPPHRGGRSSDYDAALVLVQREAGSAAQRHHRAARPRLLERQPSQARRARS